MKKDETKLSEVEQTTAETEVDTYSVESKTNQIAPNVSVVKDRRWLPYVITTAVLVVLTLLVAWAEGAYTSTEIWLALWLWGDSFAIPGAVCLAVGILVWASNGGAFDIFAYGGRSFVRMFKKKYTRDKKYPTYYDYREARKNVKRNFLYMVIVGGAFLTVGIVLLVVGSQLSPDYIK